MTDQPTPQTDTLRPLLTEVYQRGMDEDEAAVFIAAGLAQARTEALDGIEERIRALPWDMPLFVEGDPLAAVLRAIGRGDD